MKATLAGFAAGTALALVASAGASPIAFAQGNDRSAPTGGRSELMGNTGVSLGKDGSAPFINPATIGTIEDERIAFSVNFFTSTLTRYGGWNQPGPVNPQFGTLGLAGGGDSTARFNGWPSTLCLFFTIKGVASSDSGGGGVPGATPGADLVPTNGAAHAEQRGRQKVALCVGNTEGESVNLTALSFRAPSSVGSTVETESIARNWGRLYVGPTYSLGVTDALTLGASLHGVVASDSFVIDGSSISSITGSAVQSGLGASAYGYSFDLAATLGATYRAGPVTLGLSGELPAVHVLGHFQSTAHDEDTGPNSSANVSNGSGSFSARPATRVSVGIGYEKPRLTLELDESFDFPAAGALASTMHVTSTDVIGGVATTTPFDATYRVASRPTFNTSAGLEYFINQQLSVLGGASTNISTLSTLAPATSVGNLVPARSDHVAASFGIGSYGGGRDLLIGLQLDYGWGQALVVNPYQLPNQWSVTDIQTYSVTAVLAGTTDIGTIGRAVERVKNAVFTPAADTPPPPAPAPSPPAP